MLTNFERCQCGEIWSEYVSNFLQSKISGFEFMAMLNHTTGIKGIYSNVFHFFHLTANQLYWYKNRGAYHLNLHLHLHFRHSCSSLQFKIGQSSKMSPFNDYGSLRPNWAKEFNCRGKKDCHKVSILLCAASRSLGQNEVNRYLGG